MEQALMPLPISDTTIIVIFDIGILLCLIAFLLFFISRQVRDTVLIFDLRSTNMAREDIIKEVQTYPVFKTYRKLPKWLRDPWLRHYTRVTGMPAVDKVCFINYMELALEDSGRK